MASREIIIGIVVVVVVLIGTIIYNLDVTHTGGPPATETVMAFRYDRDIKAGATITDADLVRVKIPKVFAEAVGRLLGEDEKDSLAVGLKIDRDVSKDEFAMLGHFTTRPPGPEDDTDEDMVRTTIRIDGKPALGTPLRIGNHINILGALPTKDGSHRTYRIIEWLEVVDISDPITRTAGGQNPSGDSSNTAKRSSRVYKTITIKVQRNAALQWSNLQTHLRGIPLVEICPSRYPPKKGAYGKIADELLPFTTKPAAVPTSEFEDGNYQAR